MATCTARLRIRKADSCSGLGTVSGATLWKCPARGRPPNLVLDLKVSEAGAHRPLEISLPSCSVSADSHNAEAH